MKKRGKLIVIDGTDGVGKATQTKLLIERLRREKKKVETLDFPQYTQNFFGAFVGECLSGQHGDFLALSPRIASVLYAADRFESKDTIERWLAAGKTVVLDRYVSANQIHQGGKIHDAKKRKEFLTWLDTMEHKVFGLPRPDLIVYLGLPVPLSLQLLKEKKAKEKKSYLKKGGRDAHEGSVEHLLAAQKNALRIIEKSARWKKIDCAQGGVILPREVIQEQVYAVVTQILK